LPPVNPVVAMGTERSAGQRNFSRQAVNASIEEAADNQPKNKTG